MKNLLFVALVLIGFAVALTSPHAGCVDQGQPIDCSLVASK